MLFILCILHNIYIFLNLLSIFYSFKQTLPMYLTITLDFSLYLNLVPKIGIAIKKVNVMHSYIFRYPLLKKLYDKLVSNSRYLISKYYIIIRCNLNLNCCLGYFVCNTIDNIVITIHFIYILTN